MRTLTCDPGIEVLGQNMLSFIDNIQADTIRPMLEKHNLTDIQPDQWYPAQRWLAAMNDLTALPSITTNLVAIGMAITEKVVLPPEMANASLGEILIAWNDIYHMQHRGGDIGYVATEQISQTHFRTIHAHLYPDDFNYGIAYGWAKRLLPPGTDFTVKYDDDIPRQDDGGEQTVIHVMWN